MQTRPSALTGFDGLLQWQYTGSSSYAVPASKTAIVNAWVAMSAYEVMALRRETPTQGTPPPPPTARCHPFQDRNVRLSYLENALFVEVFRPADEFLGTKERCIDGAEHTVGRSTLVRILTARTRRLEFR